MDSETSLTGKLLIAMPGMQDPRFEQSVILICEHSEKGAMGLVLNRPIGDIVFRDLLEQLGIESGPQSPDIPVRYGGPVEPGRGFVLHKAVNEALGEGSMRIGPDLAVTTTRELLEDIANGSHSEEAVLALGYAGWSSGQLEGEIRANGWLTVDRENQIIFGTQDAGKWVAALKLLGINPLLLSPSGGHA